MKIKGFAACMAALLLCTAGMQASAAEKQTIYNSPYVEFSPDGKAWTTNAGDRDYEWYEEGTRVETGIPSSLRDLEQGEHYYKEDRTGEIPVGHWEVTFRTGSCVHNSYPLEEKYHGISYGRKKCMNYYYSGWSAYCADCGDPVTGMLMYMSREAAESIDYLDLDVEKDIYYDYYYLCPHCTNLEQGTPLSPHKCDAISWNQYKVKYEPNTKGTPYGGYMPDSVHMYNNATEYNGEKVSPATRLTKNAYTRTGYEFTGWNTEPDGSGTSYGDGAEILNLTAVDCNNKDTWINGEEGVVTLYAQWRRSSSTLVIDAAGGTYKGQGKFTATQEYLTRYEVDSRDVFAPAGYTVSFETNGGAAVEPVQGTRHFTEWSISPGYKGNWKNNIYTFIGPDGNTDTLTANYAHDPVVLPAAEKPGSSFGGWYYDEAFEKPAGGPGDTFIPHEDTTLYAQWAELVLEAEDNYRDNGGKGAVDLSWSQPDGKNKTYLLYQSRDGSTWTKINAAEDIGNGRKVSESWGYTGSTKTYTVPYTGMYTLSVEGAQGGNYGSFSGGRGGRTTARVWLQKGEVVSFTAGGQDGHNGGGTGSMFASGGGYSILSTDRKGTILIAGGGGSATSMGDGGAGGSKAGVAGPSSTSGAQGQSGGAGGGGGFQGGAAGEYITHRHVPQCFRTEDLGYTYTGSDSIEGWGLTDTGGKQAGVGCGQGALQDILVPGNLLSTRGNKTMTIQFHANAWSSNALSTFIRIRVYDTEKQCIFSYYADADSQEVNGTPGESWEEDDGWHGTPDIFDINTSLSVDVSGTEGVWIVYNIGTKIEVQASHYSLTINAVNFSGNTNTYTICGYTEGQVVSSKPAYGGSNYVNTSVTYHYTDEPGVRTGNGAASLASEDIGYQEGLELPGVTATDCAAPDRPDEAGVERKALGDGRAEIAWQEPEDNGTDYYHKAESYPAGSTSLLCTSNVTKNTLTSGIKGYYYLLDTKEDTAVNAGNGTFTENRSATVEAEAYVQYLHVAAVDKAGNVSGTLHIRLDENGILWKLYTRQLSIEEGDNVYPAGQEKTWYVKADGTTPFTLTHRAYMDGAASYGYQLNYSVYGTLSDGERAGNILFTPSHEISEGKITTEAEGLSYAVEGVPLLGWHPYSLTVRTDRNRQLESVQKFTLAGETSRKQIEVVPSAGADTAEGETVYSNPDADRENAVTIIADGEAPVISGMEPLEDRELIDRNEGTIHLDITARDDLSGVKDFFVKIYNTDNTIEETYYPDENGEISIDVTKDEPVFSGDFTVTAYASDNVGNEREEACSTTEFALETSVERILEPHDPVFKGGESGILTITTWGYADRVEVEFPEEFTRLEPDLNNTYVYTDTPRYKQEEKLQFMVPLYAPANQNFMITVRAYKEEAQLEEHPSLCVIEVGDNVLKDFRTRLR